MIEQEKLNDFREFYNNSNFFKFYNEDYIKILIESRYKALSKNKNITSEYYYYNIIKKTKELLREINLLSPVEISVIYEYLLWNGYFSKEKNLVYSVSNRKNLFGILGADIMRGKSVCLNNASMLTDLLNECDIEAYSIGCMARSFKNTKLEYQPDIKRNIVNSSIKDMITQQIVHMLHFDKIGNHAVTCFKNGETYSVCDPTSLAFLNFNDMRKMKYVGSNLEIIFKPWIMIILNDINNYDKFLEILITLYLNSNLELLKVDDIRNTSEKVLDFCKSNASLLNDFHSEIYKDIDGVCKALIK